MFIYVGATAGKKNEGESLGEVEWKFIFPLSTATDIVPFTGRVRVASAARGEKGFIDVTQLIYNMQQFKLFIYGDIETTLSGKKKCRKVDCHLFLLRWIWKGHARRYSQVASTLRLFQRKKG